MTVVDNITSTTPPDQARAQIESLLYKGVRPSNKFEAAARQSFVDSVMAIMGNDCRLVKV